MLWGSFYSLFKWRALQGRPTEEVAIEQRLEDIEGVCVPGRGDSKYEDFEVGVCLVSLRNNKKSQDG